MLCAAQGRVITPSYCLLPVDLRDLSGLQETLKSAGFDPSLPTYVLAECVLVYMEPQESAALLHHLGQMLPSAVCVVYEQVSLHVSISTQAAPVNNQLHSPVALFQLLHHFLCPHLLHMLSVGSCCARRQQNVRCQKNATDLLPAFPRMHQVHGKWNTPYVNPEGATAV